MYIPPESSKYLSHDELQDFENEIFKMYTLNDCILLTGDAHTDTMQDFTEPDEF